jgi:hypothetical protein
MPVCHLRLYLLFIFFATGVALFAQEDFSASSDSIQMEMMGEEVIVTGQRRATEIGNLGGRIRITPASVARLPSMLGGTDLLGALELTPSVQNSGDANSNLYVRGGDAGQNLLLYGNVPLYTPGHLMGLFPVINADHIAGLEMSKSGIAARYGGRLSSIVSVEPKTSLPKKTGFEGSVGLLSSQATLSLPIGKKFGLYLSGRKMYLNLILQPLLNAIENRGSDDSSGGFGYDLYDTNITLLGEISDKDKITINAFLGKDDLGIGEDNMRFDAGLDWKNQVLSLQWDRKMGSRKLSQQVYSSRYDNTLDIKQSDLGVFLSSSIRDVGYQNSYKFSVADVPVEVGMQYAYHELTPQVYNMTNAGQFDRRQNDETQTAQDGALFAQATYAFNQKLFADAGLRYNIFYQDKLYQSLDPRFSLRYYADSQTSFRLSYSRMHQYINMLSPSSVGIPTDFWIAASERILPQSGNEFSFGYAQNFPAMEMDISAEIYYRTMNNVTEYSQNFLNGGTTSYIEEILFGRGRAYGVEVMLKKGFGRFNGWVSYALGRSERNFDAINNGSTFPARFDRRHNLSAVGVYSFNDRWDVSVIYSFASGAAYTLPTSWYFINNTPVKEFGDYNNARMPNYNRTDVSVNYWFKKDKNGLNFSVYNLFMVGNPIYIVLDVIEEEAGNLHVQPKRKRLYNIIPTISWRFKF